MQPLADVVKLIFKEDFVPRGANRFLFQIAPMISVFAAVAAVAVIPFGDPVEILGYNVAAGRAPTSTSACCSCSPSAASASTA